MAPSMVILLFSQTISSGSGALSMAIFWPFTWKLLSGIQEDQKHCNKFCKMFGLYLKNYFDYCFENTMIAKDAVFYSLGKGLGLN